MAPLARWRQSKMDCTVEIVDLEGIRHSVDIEADALYEAVIKGVAALRKGPFAIRIDPPTEVLVHVQPPATLHVVQFSKVEAWLKSSAAPADQVFKGKLKAMLD